MPKRVVIIHGSYGSAKENWFPWLGEAVRALGHHVIIPDFPTPEGQSLQRWLEVFESRVGKLSPDIVLVGHSLGAAFILRVLERTAQTITGAFLVSGFLGELGLPEFDKVNSDFVLAPVNWPRVVKNGGKIMVYNSDNDPYVPLDKGRKIAHELGVDLTIVKGGGHINAAAGYAQFPKLLDDLQKHCLK